MGDVPDRGDVVAGEVRACWPAAAGLSFFRAGWFGAVESFVACGGGYGVSAWRIYRNAFAEGWSEGDYATAHSYHGKCGDQEWEWGGSVVVSGFAYSDQSSATERSRKKGGEY